MANRKLVGAAAMAGALTIGGVVGVALGSPSTSSAQKAAATTTAPRPGPGPGKGPGMGGPRRGPGGGVELDAAAKAIGITVDDLRAALHDGKSIADVAKDKGVDKQKVIDAMVAAASKQLDEAKEALPDRIAKQVDGTFTPPKDGKGGPGGFRGRGPDMGGGRFGLTAAAKALGISEDDLATALKHGKSIADVAKDKGVDKQKVVDAMVAAAKDAIAAQVKAGHLPQDRADTVLKDLPDHVAAFVDGKGFAGQGPRGHGPGPGPGGPGHPDGPEGPGGN